MFGKQKEPKYTSRLTNEYGIPNPISSGLDVAEDNDDEFEDELRRLTSGDDTYAPAGPQVSSRKLEKIELVQRNDLSHEGMSDGEDDDLMILDELQGILNEHITATEQVCAELEKSSINDKLSNSGALSTSAKSGQSVNIEKISLNLSQNSHETDFDVAVQSPVNEPVLPVTVLPAPINQENLKLLKKRQKEYRDAAFRWKKNGNVEEALKHLKIAKQFDIVIDALISGEPIDLSDMPPSPFLLMSATDTVNIEHQNSEHQKKKENKTQQSSDELAPVYSTKIESALKERLEVYRRAQVVANEEGNIRKSRQYQRICKQYEDAVKLHTCGKPIPIEELPIPPGFPPIFSEKETLQEPGQSIVAPIASKISSESSTENSSSQGLKTDQLEMLQKSSTHMSRVDKQILLLQRRRAELKRAALTAKKVGDLSLAKEFLRQAKGIDPLINASQSGLPVDMSSIPLSPNAKIHLADSTQISLNDNFTTASIEKLPLVNDDSTDHEIYDNLEAILIKHREVCLSTRDHAKALGDVPDYNRWERLAFEYMKDLDMLRVRKRDGLKPPRHHYEVRHYAIVQCSTDLSDGDVEISIIRGIDYSKEADTYVTYEFPYPPDSPANDKTATVKNSSNPEYGATFLLTGVINRSARQCQRIFRRHSLKCQVWSKGGFFRSDSLLGTVTIKLQPLESRCMLHDSFSLMNGRKAAGGKLEVKMRLRNPITMKQVEKMTDKWLVIDN